MAKNHKYFFKGKLYNMGIIRYILIWQLRIQVISRYVMGLGFGLGYFGLCWVSMYVFSYKQITDLFEKIPFGYVLITFEISI